MRIENVVLDNRDFELVNGATMQKIANDCEVCTSSGEEIEPAQFMVYFDGQEAQLCKAHAQKLLDQNEDAERRNDEIPSLLVSIFNIGG